MNGKPENYLEWNQFLLDEFFYKSNAGDVIRLNVTPEWFREKIQDDQGTGLIEAVCRVPQSFRDMLQAALESKSAEPNYLPLLAFFCMPFGDMDIEDPNSYYTRLQELTKNETYKEKIRNFIASPRFRNYIPEIFEKLKEWADGNKKIVHGTFCYTHLQGRDDNKIPYFQSQILLRTRDITKLKEIFYFAGLRGEQNKDYLKERILSLGYCLPASIKNLFADDSPDEMRRLLKEDILNAISWVYECWMDLGYPEPVTVTQRIERNPAGDRMTSFQLLLGISFSPEGGIQRRIFISRNEIDSRSGKRFEIQGNTYKTETYSDSFSVLLPKDGDMGKINSLWENLAYLPAGETPKEKLKIGKEFRFYQAKCFVMTKYGDSSPFLVQSPAQEISPGGFFLLFKNNTVTADRLKRDFKKCFSRTTDCGNGWMLIWITNNANGNGVQIPDGYERQQPIRLIKLAEGISTGSKVGRYLRDFLPEIHAYLPDDERKWDYRITTPTGNNQGIELLPLTEADQPAAGMEDGEQTFLSDFQSFSWHRFLLDGIPQNISECTVRFLSKTNPEESKFREKVIRFQIDDCPIAAKYRMNEFGELAELQGEEKYWPESADNPEIETFSGDEEWGIKVTDLKNEFPWDFFGTLRSMTGEGARGIRAYKLYSYFIYKYFKKYRPWKSPHEYEGEILRLSYLSMIDIETNKYGLWSRFFALPPTIYPLPDSKNYILTGCYTLTELNNLTDKINANSDNGCNILIKKQNGGQDAEFRMLPPFVKMTGPEETLRSIAKEIKIDWCDTPPAYGYIDMAASVDKWFNLIWNGNCINPASGMDNEKDWYNPLTYEFKRKVNSSANDSRADFSQSFVCYKKVDPYVQQIKYYCITKADQRDGFVYVYDRSWARWACSSNIRHNGSECVFTIPYDKKTGTFWLPYDLKLPKVIARAVVACTGRVPETVKSDLYCYKPFGYGLKRYNGKCLAYSGVPESVLTTIAEKLNASYAYIEEQGELIEEEVVLPQQAPEQSAPQSLEETVVESLREMVCNKDYAALNPLMLSDDGEMVPPVTEIRKTLIYKELCNNVEQETKKCAKILAPTFTKAVNSWRTFFDKNQNPLRPKIDQEKKKISEDDIKPFLHSWKTLLCNEGKKVLSVFTKLCEYLEQETMKCAKTSEENIEPFLHSCCETPLCNEGKKVPSVFTKLCEYVEQETEKCADKLAKSIIARVVDSWQVFYTANPNPSQEELDQEIKKIQRDDVAYFLRSKYELFYYRFYRNSDASLFDYWSFWGEIFFPEEQASYFRDSVNILKGDFSNGEIEAFKTLYLNFHDSWMAFYLPDSNDQEPNTECDDIKAVALSIFENAIQNWNNQNQLSPVQIREMFWYFLYNLLRDSQDDYNKIDLEFINLTREKLKFFINNADNQKG